MRQYIWAASVLVVLVVLCQQSEARTFSKREVAGPDPIQEVESDDVLRDKRKVDVGLGVKNALLGFVFNKPVKFAWETTTQRRPTTTEDIAIFEKGKPVSIDFPGELYGSSYTLVTNLSTTVGDFMINSALRAQRLLESMRPFLRAVFGSKGIVIEATTDKPIFSAPESK